MGMYEVPLWEGNSKTLFKVNATSKEEALEKARVAREERFQASNSRESLEQDRKRTEDELSRVSDAKTRGTIAGLKQSGIQIASGMGDAVTNTALAVADVLPGMEGIAESLKGRKDDLSAANAEIYLSIQEKAAGRKMTEAERSASLEQAHKGKDLASMGSKIVGGMAGAGATMAASTLPRMIAMGTGEGFLSGWLASDTKGETVQERNKQRIGEATLGAFLGGGLGIVPGLFAGAKNILIRQVKKATGDMSAARGLMDELGVDSVTLGQLTGDPRILAMEQESAGKLADQMMREQAEAVRSNFVQRAGLKPLPSMAEVTTGSRQVVEDGLNKTTEAIGILRGRRNKIFENGMKELETAVGGRPVINVDNMIPVANEILDGVKSAYSNVPLGKPIKDIFKEINAAQQAGGLSPKRVNSILLRLGQIKRAGHGVFDATDEMVKQGQSTYLGHGQSIAGTLKRALEQSIDTSADRLGGAAGARLKELRTGYAQQSQEIGGIEKDMLHALGMKGTPDQILQKLGQADATSVRKVMDTLDTIEGGQAYKNNLANALFRQAVSDGSQGAVGFSAKAGDFNMKAFADSLMKRVEASKLQGIITPDKEANVVRGVQALKTLFNDPRVASPTGVFKTHLAVELQNVAINLLSRDPGFTARLVAGAIQKGKGAEALFYTREGQDLLTGAVKSVVQAKRTGQLIGASAGAGVNEVLASIIGAGAADEAVGDIIENEREKLQQ